MVNQIAYGTINHIHFASNCRIFLGRTQIRRRSYLVENHEEKYNLS
jgi:hypothetical protein